MFRRVPTLYRTPLTRDNVGYPRGHDLRPPPVGQDNVSGLEFPHERRVRHLLGVGLNDILEHALDREAIGPEQRRDESGRMAIAAPSRTRTAGAAPTNCLRDMLKRWHS